MQRLDSTERRILIVDDNAAIHDDFRKILVEKNDAALVDAEAAFFGDKPSANTETSLGIHLESAYQGEDALKMVVDSVKSNTPYQIAFVDMRMPPGWDGLKTIEEIWKVDPCLQVVICTAYSDNTWETICKRLCRTDRLLVLKKPFDAIEVSQLAIALTEKWHLAQCAQLKQSDLERLVDERTARLRATEFALKQQKGFLELATSVAQVGYWRLESQSRQLTWSENMFAIFGADPTETPDLDQFLSLHHPADRKRSAKKIDSALDELTSTEYHSRIIQPSGQVRYVHTKIVCESGVDGEPVALFGVTHDTTDHERSMATIRYAAMHDPLTDVANRSAFRNRLQQDLNIAVRNDQKLAVAIFDLDGFKEINDRHGHPMGDQLLREVAGRLTYATRGTDMVARLGGDEFAIIHSPTNQDESTSSLLDRVFELMKCPFRIQGHNLEISMSGGVAVALGDGKDPDGLLRNADLALYNAKRNASGEYRFFEREMEARITHRRTIECQLKRSIENDEFVLFYQPIFDSATGEVDGLEALVRWSHPQRGLVFPDEFIEIAEETGLIAPLGDWVIQKACQDAASLPNNIHVAVNVSAVQFRNDQLVDTVTKAIEEAGIDACRLELEITETVVLCDSEETLSQLKRLQEYGVKIVMDDFGIGYSSLSYLRSFPFNRLKLDRSFVMDSSTELDAQVIVRTVANLGQNLGIETTAEGVETEAHLQRIIDEGYTHFQGYLRGKPAPLAEVVAQHIDHAGALI